MKSIKNKKGLVIWLIPIVIIIVIIIGFGLLGGSYTQLFKNLSGQTEKENNNFIASGGSSASYGHGAEFTRQDCIKQFNIKNIPTNAVCIPKQICQPYLVPPDKSGLINAQGQAEASWYASFCCGKTFLPKRCIEEEKGRSYLI